MELLTGLADAVLLEHFKQILRLGEDIKLVLGNHAPQTCIGYAAVRTSVAHKDFEEYTKLRRRVSRCVPGELMRNS